MAGFTTKLCADIDSFSCETLRKKQSIESKGLVKRSDLLFKGTSKNTLHLNF